LENLMRLLAGTPFDRPPHCERCDRPETECDCPPATAQPSRVPPQQQTARLSLEKRKKGKLVTVVRGLAATDNDLPVLLTQLKNYCGAGGTIDEETLEIQGDQRHRIQQKLAELGYRVR
jgi:translation initiation factor 1